MRVGIVSAVVVLIATLLIVSAANGQKDNAAPARLNFSTIQSDAKTGAQLIDVRTPEEYSAGFIEGAISLPLADIQAGQLPISPKDTKLYLYCHSGNRAGQAEAILRAAGYSHITNLGGISGVIAIGGTQIK